jgi:hypothetical protein
MVNSVGEHVAGEQYDLDMETADRFILLGYAEGELSRDYGEQEQQLIQATNQSVGV